MSTESRLADLRSAFGNLKIDCLLVYQPENRRYLSGFKPRDTQIDESSGSLFISMEKAVLATDARYRLQAEAQAAGFEVFIYPHGLAKSAGEIAEGLGCRRLGFESRALPYRLYEKLREELPKGVKLVPVVDAVERLRMIKDEDEINAIRGSVRVAERALSLVRERLRLGKSEREVAWEIERAIREQGAEAVAFEPIAASGEHAAEPHAEPTGRTLGKADHLILDLGARLAGYCSDMTRTFCMGRPGERFKEVYGLVRRAQIEAIKAVRPGLACADLDAVARKLFEEQGVAERFAHSLGHGVGLATHEKPSVSPRSEDTLSPGMIITVEPGLYFPDWGGVRLEQMVVVREGGYEMLNKDEDFYDFSGADTD
jgi:Xaa-Pro aminopeptidase